jgi:hypothetical protein
VPRAERLPLEREQAVALQVAKGAVVGEDVEAVARALEGAARLVAAIRTPSDVGLEHRRTIGRRHGAGHGDELIVGQCR